LFSLTPSQRASPHLETLAVTLYESHSRAQLGAADRGALGRGADYGPKAWTLLSAEERDHWRSAATDMTTECAARAAHASAENQPA